MYGEKFIPPCMKSSRFGQISVKSLTPLISFIFFNNTNIHDGTPVRLVIFSRTALSAIFFSLSSQSSINNVSTSVELCMLTQNGKFSRRIADKSPSTKSFLTFWLPPSIIPLPLNTLVEEKLLQYIESISLPAFKWQSIIEALVIGIYFLFEFVVPDEIAYHLILPGHRISFLPSLVSLMYLNISSYFLIGT